MTVADLDSFVQAADAALIEAEVRRVRAKASPGVLAIRASPRFDRTTLTVDGRPVRVVACATVLAVRDALTTRAVTEGGELVILTDLSAEQLGDGICDHLVTRRPRQPDAWLSLREAFAASAQEAGLLHSKTAARAALAQLNRAELLPAPSGVLTRDHLIRTIAAQQFGFKDSDPTAMDVLVWSVNPAAARRFEDWVERSPADLVTEVLNHYQQVLGTPGGGIVSAWRHRGAADLLALGLVISLIEGPDTEVDRDTAIAIRTRLEPYFGGTPVSEPALAGWARAAVLAAGRIARARGPEGGYFLPLQRRADQLTVETKAEALVWRSDYIPMALAGRMDQLATAASTAEESWTDDHGPAAAAMDTLESAWNRVHDHVISGSRSADLWSSEIRLAWAILRLLRFAAAGTAGADIRPNDLGSTVLEYRDGSSWADTAINDLSVGSDTPALARVANRVLMRVRAIRQSQDQAAAALIAGSGTYRANGSAASPLMIEDLLESVVLPLAVFDDRGTRTPVLLIVADGMSVPAAHEVLADLQSRPLSAWQEADFADGQGRPIHRLRAAVSVFPSLTKHSRTSLFSGRLATGDQRIEQKNFRSWLSEHSLGARTPVLFHKADIEAASAGHAVPEAIRQAIDDTVGRPVVACVLNAIDDALDRSDPIGTHWDLAALRPLEALLQAAARVGRVVVLTSDHGHVVERREQPSRLRGQSLSARWRPVANGVELESEEVLLAGDRVRVDGQRAVLAFAEQLRYAGLKAGYHGGASLAEAVIPVTVLVAGDIPEHLPLIPSAGGVPEWWVGPQLRNSTDAEAIPARAPSAIKTRPPRGSTVEPSLFDQPEVSAGEDVPPPVAVTDPVSNLLKNKVFRANWTRFASAVPLERIASLLQALIAAGGSLGRPQVAVLLRIPDRRLAGTLAVVGQVMNIDGVVVLTQNGTEVNLNVGLLFEQFGIQR